MNAVQTGDDAADRVLRLILALAEGAPRSVRDDIRVGVQSITPNYRFMCFQTGLDQAEVEAALDYLDAEEYLRVCEWIPGHCPQIFLRCRLEAAA